MARHANDNEELRRATAQANDMFRARMASGAGRAAPRDARVDDTRDIPAAERPVRQTPSRQNRQDRNANSRSLASFLRRNATYVISVVAVVIVVVLMIAFLRGCVQERDDATGGGGDAPVITYNWDNLDRTNGRYAYVVDGQVKSRLGIDVSESQQGVDWDAVAADGIDFAIIRVGYRGSTEGGLYVDQGFRDNLDGAKSAGLDCGAYFFSQAVSVEEAREEADFVIEQLAGARLEYPVAFDSEIVPGDGAMRTQGLTNDEMTAIADAFCRRMTEAGYRTLVYGNTIDLDRYDAALLKSQPVWWAEYGSSEPNHDIDIVMWQYDNMGQVAGVPTNVDMNLDLSGVQ